MYNNINIINSMPNKFKWIITEITGQLNINDIVYYKYDLYIPNYVSPITTFDGYIEYIFTLKCWISNINFNLLDNSVVLNTYNFILSNKPNHLLLNLEIYLTSNNLGFWMQNIDNYEYISFYTPINNTIVYNIINFT
jgi:hypothetical protein